MGLRDASVCCANLLAGKPCSRCARMVGGDANPPFKLSCVLIDVLEQLLSFVYLSLRGVAAVDDQRRPGDIRRMTAAEEEYGGGDLLWFADAVQRVVGGDLF